MATWKIPNASNLLQKMIVPGYQQRGPAQQFSRARRSANAANQRRYDQILDLYNRQYDNAQQFGNFERELVNRRTNQAFANDAQDLISSGRYNTSTLQSVRRGHQFDQSLLNMGIGERVLMAQNDVLRSKAGAIERRTDMGPDDALIANLFRGAGASRF